MEKGGKQVLFTLSIPPPPSPFNGKQQTCGGGGLNCNLGVGIGWNLQGSGGRGLGKSEGGGGLLWVGLNCEQAVNKAEMLQVLQKILQEMYGL